MNIKIQDKVSESEEFLPILRQDIQLIPGPNEDDGTPTFNLYDPVRTSYYKITWAEALIFDLLKPQMTMSTLLSQIKRRSTLDVTEEGLKSFFLEAEKLGLLALS